MKIVLVEGRVYSIGKHTFKKDIPLDIGTKEAEYLLTKVKKYKTRSGVISKPLFLKWSDIEEATLKAKKENSASITEKKGDDKKKENGGK
jgi:hypothetical protein